MPFQFYCPVGHLLLGEESRAGQVCACPCCDAAFVMPQASPPAEPPSPWASGESASVPGFPGAAPPPIQPMPPELPTIQLEQEPPVHIPCPSGHQLETPRDMLGQDALCPFCQVRFHLRWEDSIEYREERERREDEI